MSEVLRDPIWQIVSVFVAIIAVFVSVGLYFKQRRRKSLSYEIIASTSLFSMKEEIKGKIRILYDDKPVQQVHLIELKLKNSGNMPILHTDYERPVSLNFGEEAQILTTEIREMNPENLGASVLIEKNKVTIGKTLMNEGDSFNIKMLVSKFDGKIHFDGRIIGVKEISQARKSYKRHVIAFIVGMVLTAIGLWWNPPTDGSVLETLLYWLDIVFLLGGVSLLALPLLDFLEDRDKQKR